jgi:hypothetical protein
MKNKTEHKQTFLEKLRKRWNLTGSPWQVVIILVVFALTGTTMLFIKKPIYFFLGIMPESSVYLRILVWSLTVLPVYQVVLLFYGFLFGQFSFFWEFEKKMWQRIKNIFKAK